MPIGEGPKLAIAEIEEILSSPSVVIVEWAEKLLLQPKNPVTVRISVEPRTARRRSCPQSRPSPGDRD